jgi:hypothetical protein
MSELTTKQCTGCERNLPLDDFHVASRDKSTRQYRCKDCVREYNQQPEQKRAAYRRHLLRTYGLTIERYEELEASQDGRCAICARLPHGYQRLVVDHDHDTGVIRGLLCVSCNVALGSFSSKERLTSALSYLHEYTA